MLYVWTPLLIPAAFIICDMKAIDFPWLPTRHSIIPPELLLSQSSPSLTLPSLGLAWIAAHKDNKHRGAGNTGSTFCPGNTEGERNLRTPWSPSHQMGKISGMPAPNMV